MNERIKELEEENAKLKELLARYHGRYQPFICGVGEEKGEDGLPTTILVCPMMGSDGFAIYKKHKNYSAPGY